MRDTPLPTTGPTTGVQVFLLLFVTIGIYQIGTGMLMGVVPVQLSLNGFSASVVGWVATVQSLGFLAGSLLAAPMTARLGARPTLYLFAVINAVAALALWFSNDPWLWTGSRIVAGFSSGWLLRNACSETMSGSENKPSSTISGMPATSARREM